MQCVNAYTAAEAVPLDLFTDFLKVCGAFSRSIRAQLESCPWLSLYGGCGLGTCVVGRADWWQAAGKGVHGDGLCDHQQPQHPHDATRRSHPRHCPDWPFSDSPYPTFLPRTPLRSSIPSLPTSRRSSTRPWVVPSSCQSSPGPHTMRSTLLMTQSQSPPYAYPRPTPSASHVIW